MAIERVSAIRPHHQESAQNFPVKNPWKSSATQIPCLACELFDIVSVREAEGFHASAAPARSPFWDLPSPIDALCQESELETKQDLGSELCLSVSG